MTRVSTFSSHAHHLHGDRRNRRAMPALNWLLANPQMRSRGRRDAAGQSRWGGSRSCRLRRSSRWPRCGMGCRYCNPANCAQPESVAKIVALQADVIVVMAYGQILPKVVLEAPRLACLNLHASLLPRWRGAAPIQAAIRSGRRSAPVCTADAYGRRVGYRATSCPCRRRRSRTPTPAAHCTIVSGEGSRGGRACRKLCRSWPPADAPRTPQDHALANYAAKLSRENGLIDWHATPAQIDRRIRAMNPWPAAHTFLPAPGGARQLKIFAGAPQMDVGGVPGEVLRADECGLLVAALGEAMLLSDIQLEAQAPG